MAWHSTPGTTLEAFKRACKEEFKRVEGHVKMATENGDYKGLAFKGASAALGCYMIGTGVHQLSMGVNETVPNPEKEGETQRNWMRVFVGGMTAFMGASALYLALVTNLGMAHGKR